MRATSPPPEHSKIGRWVGEGENDLLRVRALNVREVLSPLLIASAVVAGLVVGAISAVAGASIAFSALAGVLVAGVLLSLISYMRLSLNSRAIVLGTGSPEHVETVRLLIEGGADVTIPDGNGVSPRELAASRGYSEIVSLIDAAR